MQHARQIHLSTRLVVALAGVALVAPACGAEQVDSTDAPAPASSVVTEDVVEEEIAEEELLEEATTATAPPTTTPTIVPTSTVPEQPPVEPADVPEAVPTTTVPPTTMPPVDDFVEVSDEPGPCTLAPVPEDALIGEELWFDLGEGNDGHRVLSYLSDGTWKLRVEFADGAASELELPAAAVHGVRPLGFVDVDSTFGGDELLAVVGGGASAVEIGVFAFLEGGCIHRYQSELGGDFGALVGGTIGSGSGLTCGEGHLVVHGYQLEEDDTYTMWSAAYEPVSLPVFGYLPGSDDIVEGASWEDVVAMPLFDCGGLSV